MKRILGGAVFGAAVLTVSAASVLGGVPPKKKAVPPAKPAAAAKPPAVAPTPKPTHPAPHWAVAFSPDGNTVVVGTYRKVLRFDAQIGTKTSEWTVSGDAVRALAFSPDGTKIALGTGVPAQSGSVLILDAQTGQVLQTIRSHTDTVEAVAWKSAGEVLSASDDEKVGLFDATTGQKTASLSEHTGRALSVLTFPTTGDGSAGDVFVTGGADKTVKVWDGALRRVVVNFDQSPGAVWSLAFLPRTSGRFAAGCDDGQIRVFGVRMDGSKPANTNEPQARTGFLARTLSGHEGAVYAVASGPDGSLVSGGADKKVILWAAGGGIKKREWTDATGDIWGVAVSPDGAKIAAASEDGHTRVYNAQNGTLLFALGGGATVTAPPIAAMPPAFPVSPAANKPTGKQ